MDLKLTVVNPNQTADEMARATDAYYAFLAKEAHAAAFDAALVHSLNCQRCSKPIIRDEEGNPGLQSEACIDGAKLLQRLEDAENAFLSFKDSEAERLS